MATDYASQAFELQRKRALEDVNKAGQQEQEALARRFASQGGLGSGSFIKQQGLQQENAFQRRQKALQDVDTQELGFKAQQQEAERAREFSAQEAGKQRDFASGERKGTEMFQSGQAEAQRGFVSKERLGGQDFAAQQAAIQRNMEDIWKGNDTEAKREQLRQGLMALNMELDAQNFNKEMATWQRDNQGLLGSAGGLFGSGLQFFGPKDKSGLFGLGTGIL
jgi:hypothetical protein